MNKLPIVCPKCKEVYNEESLTKRHPLDPSEPIEQTDPVKENYEDIDDDKDFFLDTPTELIESLEELEEGYEPEELLKG